MTEKRTPQVYDTIGKDGNYWRITEIDEKGSVTAWKLYDGTIYKKGRPLRISVQKILDGTFRLLDIPPVTVTHREPVETPQQKNVEEPAEAPEADFPEEGDALPKDYWVKKCREYRNWWQETRKELALASEKARALQAELNHLKEREEENLENALQYKTDWQKAINEENTAKAELKKAMVEAEELRRVNEQRERELEEARECLQSASERVTILEEGNKALTDLLDAFKKTLKWALTEKGWD